MEFCKNSGQFGAKVQLLCFMNHKIKNAHTLASNSQNSQIAQNAYEEVFLGFLDNKSYKIALDPKGVECNTEGFVKLLHNRAWISFFIGGAFGFSKGFLEKCDTILSLSKLTLSHKIAQALLCEQIFRALSLMYSHPYHK